MINKISAISIKALALSLFAGLVFQSPAWAIDIPFIGDEAKEGQEQEIWRATEQYVMLKPQDTKQAEPNDHPVDIPPREIATALTGLEYWKEGWFKSNAEEEANNVLTRAAAQSLAARLSEGLRKAKPEQDVVFAIAQLQKVMLGMKDRAYVAGRAFYKDGKLNLILGDYNRLPDKGKEMAAKAHGLDVTETTYFFDEGSRTSAGDFDYSVMTGKGIEVHEGEDGVRRNDWFVIDVDQVMAAADAQRRQAEEGAGGGATREMRLEAARLQKEQRELKLEMARMREAMKKQSGGSGGETVEERLSTLEKLYKQDLINKEEYETKREQILSDI